jgi:hypothetical protein
VAGILPGAGSTLASFLAYGTEKRFSKNRRKMGTGAIEGVAAPDAATSSAANGAFVPTLTLGVPGGATTAVLLGAFLLYGITPGPLLFEQEPTLVWGLLVSFLVAHLLLLMLNLPMAPIFAQLLRVRYGYLYPLIIFTSFIGAYAVSNNTFSLWVVLVFGMMGYVMKRLNFPIAPLVLGLVLGSIAGMVLTTEVLVAEKPEEEEEDAVEAGAVGALPGQSLLVGPGDRQPGLEVDRAEIPGVGVSNHGEAHRWRRREVQVRGAAVLDVGVSRVDGKIAGDVAGDVWDTAGWVSPNPGGVGPMTRAMLLSNVVSIAEQALVRA